MIAQRIRKLLSVKVLTNQKRSEKRPFLNDSRITSLLMKKKVSNLAVKI